MNIRRIKKRADFSETQTVKNGKIRPSHVPDAVCFKVDHAIYNLIRLTYRQLMNILSVKGKHSFIIAQTVQDFPIVSVCVVFLSK